MLIAFERLTQLLSSGAYIHCPPQRYQAITLTTGSMSVIAIYRQLRRWPSSGGPVVYTELDHSSPAVRTVPLSHWPDGATAILSGATACSLVR
jgi:hypothetical protein